MAKYLKDHPYMEPDGLQEEQLEEKFSKEERRKRAKKCDNPKGFTMKQFCKNQKTRSKKGERTNEGKDPILYQKPRLNQSLTRDNHK